MSYPRYLRFRGGLPHPAVMQAYYAEQAGAALPADEMLALALASGLDDAHLDRGEVVARGVGRGVSVLRTTGDVERMATYRAQRRQGA